MGCGASASSEPVKVEDNDETPVLHNLEGQAEQLLDQPGLTLDAIAALLKELEAHIKPPRRRCKYGHKCYRQSRRHRAEEAHPGDLDWHEKGEPQRQPLPAATREQEPFAKLRKRLGFGVVRALCSLPAGAPIDLAAGGPDTDDLDVEGAAVAAQSDASQTQAPPLLGNPGEGDPFDLAAFLEGLRDDGLPNEALSFRISASVVMGYATDAGLIASEWGDTIQAAARNAAVRCIGVASSRGAECAPDGDGFLYFLAAVIELGVARDSADAATLVQGYTGKCELPAEVGGAVMDMVAKPADPLASVLGSQRVAWFRFQDVLLAQAGGISAPVDVLEQILVPLVDPAGSGHGEHAAPSVREALARFLGDEVRGSVPGANPDSALEVCEAWEAGLDEAEGVEAVQAGMGPVRFYHLATQVAVQDVEPLPETLSEVVTGLLQWAVDTGERAPLHFALYAAYCLGALGDAGEAIDAWQTAQGLPEWWTPQAVFPTYGTDGYTGLHTVREFLLAGDEEGPWDIEAATEALGHFAIDGDECPRRNLVVGFIASALTRDAHTKFGDPAKLLKAVNELDVDQANQEVPSFLQWHALAKDLGLSEEEAVRTAEGDGFQKFAALCNEEADKGDGSDEAMVNLFMLIFVAVKGPFQLSEEVTEAKRKLLEGGHRIGRPAWWDYLRELNAMEGEDVIERQAWTGLRHLAISKLPIGPDQLRAALTVDDWQCSAACKQLAHMAGDYIGSLPLDFAAEVGLCPWKWCDLAQFRCMDPSAGGVLAATSLLRAAALIVDEDDEARSFLTEERCNEVGARYLGQAQTEKSGEAVWYALLACAALRINTDVPSWNRVAQDFRDIHGLPHTWDVRQMADDTVRGAGKDWQKAMEFVTKPMDENAQPADLAKHLEHMLSAGQVDAMAELMKAKLFSLIPAVEEEALPALRMEDSDIILDDVIVPVKWCRALALVVQGQEQGFEHQKLSQVALKLADDAGSPYASEKEAEECVASLEHAAKEVIRQVMQVCLAGRAEDAVFRRLFYITVNLAPAINVQEIVTTVESDYWQSRQGLPRWFDGAAMVSHGYSTPEGRRAWREALRVASASPTATEECFNELVGSLEELGVDDETRRDVLTGFLIGLLKGAASSPVELAAEAQQFANLLPETDDSDRSLSEAASAAVRLKLAGERAGLFADGGEHRITRPAVEGILLWAKPPPEIRVDIPDEQLRRIAFAMLFALLVAQALDKDAHTFGLFREVCERFGRKDVKYVAEKLLPAYDRWDLGITTASLLASGPLDVDAVVAQLEQFRGTRVQTIAEGVQLHIPGYEDLLKQCSKQNVKQTLLWKMGCKRKAAESRWRNIAGQRATIREASDGVLKVETESNGTDWIAVPEDGVGIRSLDFCCHHWVMENLVKALESAPVLSEEESQAFEEAKENGGDDLEGSLRVVSLWSVVQRLGMQDQLGECRKQVAHRHIMAAMGDSQAKLTVQVGLYIGSCLGEAESVEFEFLAEAYRTLACLPVYWNVKSMVAAYATGGLAPGSIWEEAEEALQSPDGGAPDKDKVNAVLAKGVAGEADSEPWVSLRMAMPMSVPAYWDSSGDTGRFDRMVSVAMRDPLGRPSEIYPCVQKLLDETWKDIATRDRPCPKKTCDPRPGGCRCVQKDGDPGMPDGLRVRRIIRIEDSDMWERYVKKKDEIAELRAGDTGPELEVKTTPHLAESPYFLDLDPAANEMYLFHGTFVRAALSIAQEGFNMNLAGSNVGTMYGRGGYFCESCSKADEYAKDEPDGYYEGVFAMLLCRIAFGKPFITESRDEEARRHTVSGDSDSTLGDREKRVNTYREFVIYDIGQVYPEYVILYERQGPGYEVQGGLSWGALRRQDSKIVLEVPSNWENSHADPAAQAFQGCYQCLGLMTLFLQELASRQMKLAGGDGELRVHSAYRLEDSEVWVTYLQARRRLQERGCEPLSSVLGQDSEYASATERAIVMEALRGNARKRCKYGARCYRRDKNPAHARDLCHPGDPDWELRGEEVPSAKLSDVAAWLLEGVDRKINEIYLWCAVEWINSHDDLYKLLEAGVNPLFQEVHEHGARGLKFLQLTESPTACLDRLPPVSPGRSRRALVFCRTLCGRVQNMPDLADNGALFYAFSQGQDACVQKSEDGRHHDYVVFQPSHIYPEYCIFLVD